MSFRFRLGPFTFGRTGTRLSLWRGSGISVPLSGKGRTFGKIGLGPFSWFFSRPPSGRSAPPAAQLENDGRFDPFEATAINALRSDQQFVQRLRSSGMPWRGVQERIKDELPIAQSERDHIAYSLVPRVMNAVFGQQESGWKTEKRPLMNGSGQTTWIVARKTSHTFQRY